MKKITLISSLAVVAQVATAATIVYDNDFSSTGLATEVTDAQWTLPGGGVYNNTIGSATVSSATTQVTAANTIAGFSMTSSFTLSSIDGTGTTVGFAALADSATLADDYLLADLNTSSQSFRIYSIGGGLELSSATYAFAISTGVEYTFTLTGVYSGSDMDLTFTVDNGTTAQSIVGTLTAADLVSMGDYFGYRDRTATYGVLNVDYDYLTIAVPEPGTFALLAGCFALGAVMIRRRQ